MTFEEVPVGEKFQRGMEKFQREGSLIELVYLYNVRVSLGERVSWVNRCIAVVSRHSLRRQHLASM